jgi:uncharacterized membrane protein YgaE (UPF0421/DUF939 family)
LRVILADVIRARDALSRLLGGRSAGAIGWSYLLRTLAAALVSFAACKLLGIASPVWALVSSVVVIMPGDRASITNAALRVVANVVGAGVGAGLASFGLPMLAEIVLGLPIVAGVCHLLALDIGARTAGVALVIVVVKDPQAVVGSSQARVAQVLLGCAVALAVTVVAASAERLSKQKAPPA